MSPGLKYTLARLGLFAACAAVAGFALPSSIDLFLRLMIALLVSAGLSFFLLRRMRDELATQMSHRARRRAEQKERLRAALAGDESE